MNVSSFRKLIHYYKLVFILFTASSTIAFAQNKSGFSITNENIKHVKFDAKQVAKITVNNGKWSEFQFQSSSESTYQNDLYFDYKIENETLIISDIYPKHLEYGDNKMTSTQVFSVEVTLTIPENISLYINSKYASTLVKGMYKNITINTKTGNCKLDLTKTNANISTYSGNISVVTKDVNVQAESQNGSVDLDDFLIKKYWLSLKSIDGNISVKKA